MAPKPLPPEQIKPLPTTIGIEEGRGGHGRGRTVTPNIRSGRRGTNGGPPAGRA